MGRRAQQKSDYKTRAKGRKTHAHKDFGLYNAFKCFLSTLRANIDREFKQPLKTSTTLGLAIPRSPSAMPRRGCQPPSRLQGSAEAPTQTSRTSWLPRLCNLLSPPPHPPTAAAARARRPAGPAPARAAAGTGAAAPDKFCASPPPPGRGPAGSSGGAAAAGRRYRDEPRA